MNEIIRMAQIIDQEHDPDKRAEMRGVLRILEQELPSFEPTKAELNEEG